jgi:hypothetical protein
VGGETVTYKAAIFGLERRGIPTHPRPLIYCDGSSCGATCDVTTERGARGRPFAWFLDGKAAKGWAVEHPNEPGKRRDWCPKCKEKRHAD